MHFPAMTGGNPIAISVNKPEDAYSRAALFGIGCIALWYGSNMSYSFGKATSEDHAWILASLALVCAFMPVRIERLRAAGREDVAKYLTFLLCAFIAVEYFTHLGYTVGHRVEKTKQSEFHNGTKLTEAKKAAQRKEDELKRNIAAAEDLRKQKEAAITAAPEVSTVTSISLQSERDTLQHAVELETANGGCKSKCQQKMTKVADMDKRIGRIKAYETAAANLAALDATIAEAQKAADAGADKVISTGVDVSPVAAQVDFVSQLATRSLDPSAEARTWTQIVISAFVSLVTTFLAPTCFFLASANSAPSSIPLGRREEEAKPHLKVGSLPALQSPGPVHNTTITVQDSGGSIAEEIAQLCRQHTRHATPMARAA